MNNSDMRKMTKSDVDTSTGKEAPNLPGSGSVSVADEAFDLSDADRATLQSALKVLKIFPNGKTDNPEEKNYLISTLNSIYDLLHSKGIAVSSMTIIENKKERAETSAYYNRLVNDLDGALNISSKKFNWKRFLEGVVLALTIIIFFL